MALTDGELDQLLRSHARIHDVDVDEPGVRAAMDAVTRAAVATASADAVHHVRRVQSRRRARRRATWAAALTSATLLVGGGVAVASGVDLYSGFFGSESSTEGDGSEYLDSGSAQFPELIRAYADDAGLAPGFEPDPLIANVQGTGGLYQEAGLRATVASWSYCTWAVTWLEAHERGDAAAAEEAAAQMRRRANDPAIAEGDGGGVVEAYEAIAEAAAAGDPGPVERDLAVNGGCERDL